MDTTCTIRTLRRFSDVVHLQSMPLTIEDVVRLIMVAAENREEEIQLLVVAGHKPSLWDEVPENDVVGVLRAHLRKEEGRRDLLAKQRQHH